MKKIILTAVATTFAISAVQAADYPQACTELENLTVEAAELMPEMQAQLDAAGSEEERKEAARQAWAQMSEDQQEQTAKNCETGVAQMKQVLEAIKAQK